MMDKFIPIEKMNKKRRIQLNNAKRNTWGWVNPVTRKSDNKKAYSRKKDRRNWGDYSDSCGLCYLLRQS